MIVGLDHIAIAVPDLEKAIRRLSQDFGLTCSHREDVAPASTTTAFFPVPPTRIELLHPIEGQGPVAKYLAKRGGGLHHICFTSDDIDADVKRLRELGYQFLSDAPAIGAHGCHVIFLDPTCCDGVLVELSQPAAGHTSAPTTN